MDDQWADDRIADGKVRARTVHQPIAHDSAGKHVNGSALYVDDIATPANTVHVVPYGSPVAHGEIEQLDVALVAAAPGVIAVLTAADIPGANDISPTGTADDPLLAAEKVHFAGQPIFAVVAESRDAARQAMRHAVVKITPLPAVLSIEDALQKQDFVVPSHTMRRGNPDQGLAAAAHRLQGRIEIGGQEHFYLEGQVSLALPQEDGDVLVQCSTQHPSEVQHLVAQVLGRSSHNVTIETRRMGGGFGGKETQASQWAALAALAAVKTGRPAKTRLDRDDDMIMTGKRHEFLADYDVGFDATGRICAIKLLLAGRCGFSADLSGGINDRAMFHADNGYYLEQVEIVSHRCRTNTVSNTAFRGFGGPQGMVVIERVMDAIARHLHIDPLTVRLRNLYGAPPRNVTPYHMTVSDNILPKLIPELVKTSDYDRRRKAIATFNKANPYIKRGLALTPVKFGISFTLTHLNQAGALVHIYNDGSVHLNHGGTEMGQGLFIKVAQVVAEIFCIDVTRVKITATNTGKVPNTSPTAASSGSDINGMAAANAAKELRRRLTAFAAAFFDVTLSDIQWDRDRISAGSESLSFAALVKQAYLHRISLSATGFYATPEIYYDRASASGRPFYYFAYGAAVSEVSVDLLTGEYRLDAVDILHDAGRSLNEAIDLGQVEGGFIQGLGWLTSEELVWDRDGQLRTHAPSTYKIPTVRDRPARFRMQLVPAEPNPMPTIYRSKAVGEPPLMLALSAFHAISDAIASIADYRQLPPLDAPATPERVLAAVTAVQAAG